MILELSNEIIIHILIWIILLTILSYAWNTKKLKLKFAYSLVGAILFFYTRHLIDTTITSTTYTGTYLVHIIEFSGYMFALYFTLLGIYFLFK